MTEQITEEQKEQQLKDFQDRINGVLFQEKINSGTSWTRNEKFDENGYYLLENLWDPKELFSEPPEKRGLYNYFGKKEDQFNHQDTEVILMAPRLGQFAQQVFLELAAIRQAG